MWVFKPNAVTTGMRSAWSLWTKLATAGQASIVAENIGLAPDATGVINDVTSKVPNILELGTEIPFADAIMGWLVSNVGWLQSLGADFQNFANLWIYSTILGGISAIGWAMGGEKWRLWALGDSVVLTAISASMFSEMYDTMQSNGRDLLGYLPRKFYDDLPDGVDNYLVEENREAIYGVFAGAVAMLTGKKAIKNLGIVVKWPKSKRKTPKKS